MLKVLIFAYEFRQAEYYARQVLNLQRSAWKFVENNWDIRGCRGQELIFINAPRYTSTFFQRERRHMLLVASRAWGLNIKEVELP